MDDFVVNVRQIGQYPQLTFVGPSDLALLQQGGLGGPYATVDCTTLVETALRGGGWMQLSSGSGFTWPSAGGSFSFSSNAFFFSHQINAPHLNVTTALINGEIPATQDWVAEAIRSVNIRIDNTVWAFNGRTGTVFLNQQDINGALCLDPCDQVASQSWVNAALCQAIPAFYYSTPLVYTWNGRVGDVFLTADDIANAYFQEGVYPTAPSPPLGDASKRIATTAFVDESLEEWANQINNSWNAADFELLNILQTQYAPLNSPAFTGNPVAPTPSPGDNTGNIATTAFVHAAIVASTTGVASFNTRTGAVVFTAADLNSVNGATLNSPTFTGTPRVPLAPGNDNSSIIASTAWVQGEIAAISAGVTSWNGRSGIVNLQWSDVSAVGGAPLAAPAFTGNPTAPTQPQGTNNTTLATTAFVLANAGVTAFNSRTGSVVLQWADVSAVGGAPLASPIFTGTPVAPTAAPGTNTGQLATTAFVVAALGGASVVNAFNGRTGAVTFTPADLLAVNGAFYAQADAVPATGPNNTFWFDSQRGQLYVQYTDPVSSARNWVIANSVPAQPIPAVPGQLTGLGMVWGSANLLNIGMGAACSDDGSTTMVLPTQWGKAFKTAWAAGSGSGSLDTGAIAALTWYHVFLIMNPTTKAVDILTSLSATAPTMPSGFTLKRRIGSIRTDTSANSMNMLPFTQVGDHFTTGWGTGVFDIVSNAGGSGPSTWNVAQCLTPPGVRCLVVVLVMLYNTNQTINIVVRPTDVQAGYTGYEHFVGAGGPTPSVGGTCLVPTDLNRQISYQTSAAVGNGVYLATQSYFDNRGK